MTLSRYNVPGIPHCKTGLSLILPLRLLDPKNPEDVEVRSRSSFAQRLSEEGALVRRFPRWLPPRPDGAHRSTIEGLGGGSR